RPAWGRHLLHGSRAGGSVGAVYAGLGTGSVGADRHATTKPALGRTIGWSTRMGSIVVGYVPKPEGRAALDQGVVEARLRDATVVVVLSRRSAGDESAADEEKAEVEALLADTGVGFEVRPLASAFDPAEDLITVATEK